MFIFLNLSGLWIHSSLIDQLAGVMFIAYSQKALKLFTLHPIGILKKQTSMFDLCRESGNRLILQLISASTEYKKRLSNSDQIDNLSRYLA